MNFERDMKNIALFAMRVAQVAMLGAQWYVMGSDKACTGDRRIDGSHNEGYCESDGQISDYQLKNSQMARVIREGSTVIINASTKHSATVILSHGLGDSADGWTDAAEEMARQLPHIKWILPTAPTNPVTLNGGMRMPSWYDIESLSRSRSQQECKGINESTDNLHRIISAENGRGIESSRIVLAGFSQGGAMSLWTGLQFPSSFQSRLAGVLVLSGYLPKEHAFSLSEHGKETPVLHCHGTIDAVVLPEFAEESRAKIMGAGHAAGYELRTYRGMAHSANMQEIMDVIHWLGGIVPDIKTYTGSIMNAATGEWALKKLVLRYSETGGSSLGVRFYFRHLLESWKAKNPQVEVETQHSQFEHPNLSAEWITGETHSTNMANLQPKQIENLLNFYRNSQGANLYLRHGGPRCWTERRSIQGLWEPSLESSLKSLKWFHKGTPVGGAVKASRKNWAKLQYSPASIRLASEHYNGLTSGRWGANQMHGTPVDVGFSKETLRRVFSNPFTS